MEPTLTKLQASVFEAYRQFGDWQAVADHLKIPMRQIKRATNLAYETFEVSGAMQLMTMIGMTKPLPQRSPFRGKR